LIFVCCECCVLLGRGLCDELITRLEESYRLRCVVVCDLETLRMRRPWPALGRSATKKKSYEVCCLYGCFVYHILSYSFVSIFIILYEYMVVCFVCFCLIL
jgi:hypothetical protein